MPFPPPKVPPGLLSLLFLAIRDLAVKRFDGSLLIRPVVRPREQDGSGPDERVLEFTIGLSDDVDPREVIRAVDEVVDTFFEVVSHNVQSKA